MPEQRRLPRLRKRNRKRFEETVDDEIEVAIPALAWLSA